jgi:hypothetical protein
LRIFKYKYVLPRGPRPDWKIEDRVEEALLRACFVTGAVVERYAISVEREFCSVEVEFSCEPDDMSAFLGEINEALREGVEA